jgi:hypothetical protein
VNFSGAGFRPDIYCTPSTRSGSSCEEYFRLPLPRRIPSVASVFGLCFGRFSGLNPLPVSRRFKIPHSSGCGAVDILGAQNI